MIRENIYINIQKYIQINPEVIRWICSRRRKLLSLDQIFILKCAFDCGYTWHNPTSLCWRFASITEKFDIDSICSPLFVFDHIPRTCPYRPPWRPLANELHHSHCPIYMKFNFITFRWIAKAIFEPSPLDVSEAGLCWRRPVRCFRYGQRQTENRKNIR